MIRLSLAAALAMALAAHAQVTLRGGEATPDGPIVAVDESGVWLGPPLSPGATPDDAAGTGKRGLGSAPAASAAVLGISWDRVKSVEGPFSQRAAPFAAIADEAWRARTRLERADFPAAEPLFEKLFLQHYRGRTGPTAAVVAEGLLRCRIHRAAHLAAIEPWLTLLRTGGATTAPALHASWAQDAGLSPIIDQQTNLCPGLPPIWLAWKAVDNFTIAAPAAKQEERPTAADARAQDFAELYSQAAHFEVGQPATLPKLASSDPGVVFVWQIVASRIGNAEEREAARKSLSDRLTPPTTPNAAPVPAWQEAWCYAAIGRSLIREDSPDLKRLGVVELLNLPARYARTHPYLAGLALAESSATLRQLGDAAGADVLAAELFREYPTHPAVDWGPMRSFIPKAEPIGPKAPAPQPTPADPPAPSSAPPSAAPNPPKK